MIIVDSHIGYGSPHKQDTKEAHGEALGEEEIKLTKKFYGWPEDAKFLVPDGVRENFRRRDRQARQELQRTVDKRFSRSTRRSIPIWRRNIERMEQPRAAGRLGQGSSHVPRRSPRALATRDSSGKVLNAIAKNVPWLMGGAADLAPSTMTLLTFDGAGDFEAGNYRRATSTSAFANMAWARSSTAWSLSKIRAFGCDVLRLHRLHAAADPALGDHGNSRRSGSSRTIRSASAKTAQRISRSSIWRAAGHSRPDDAAARAMPTKWSRPGGSSCR